MKKLFTLFLLALLPLMASADPVEIDGIWYNLVSKVHSAEVTRDPSVAYYLGAYSGEIVIPDKVTYEGKEYSVTSIGGSAFSYCNLLTAVTIGNSVTSIGIRAFLDCGRLTSVIIPNSVKSIEVNAFHNCGSLTAISIGSSVSSIGENAFSGCSSLTSVAIPNSVISIGENAFLGCSSLTSVTIGGGVTTILGSVFSGCSSLESIKVEEGNPAYDSRDNCNAVIEKSSNTLIIGCKNTIIPNSVTSIGSGAFSGRFLTSITIPNSVTSIGDWAFSVCNTLTSITIPNSVTSIRGGAFYECSSLTTVSIGSGVKKIDYDAFSYCPELTDVYCYAENVPQTAMDAFRESYIEYATLHVPEGCVDAYNEVEPWKNFKGIFSMDETRYILTYKVDGEVYKTYELYEGETIISEAEPTKEGYTFSGWSDMPATMPAEDITVAGSFTINKYNLIYMVDGEEYMNYDVDYGASITPEPAPTKEGYTFSGWSEIPETMPACDVTVSGKFTINKYKLIYQVDGEDYKSYEVEYGSSITPEPSPTKDGYVFLGWSEIPETMPAEDVTVTGTFILQTTEDEIKITSAGQTTWCSAYDLDFSDVEGLKAYTATGYHRTKGTIWLTRVKEVPAGEGILLIGDAGDYKVPHKSTTAYYANLMVGTVKAITINETDGEYTNYYLSSGASGVGFYKVNGSVDLKANRAYLPLLKSTTSGSRGFIGLDFDDGEDGTTGISEAPQRLTEKDVYYNLQGQRVDNPSKGLYIKNGKKVVIK